MVEMRSIMGVGVRFGFLFIVYLFSKAFKLSAEMSHDALAKWWLLNNWIYRLIMSCVAAIFALLCFSSISSVPDLSHPPSLSLSLSLSLIPNSFFPSPIVVGHWVMCRGELLNRKSLSINHLLQRWLLINSAAKLSRRVGENRCTPRIWRCLQLPSWGAPGHIPAFEDGKWGECCHPYKSESWKRLVQLLLIYLWGWLPFLLECLKITNTTAPAFHWWIHKFCEASWLVNFPGFHLYQVI